MKEFKGAREGYDPKKIDRIRTGDKESSFPFEFKDESHKLSKEQRRERRALNEAKRHKIHRKHKHGRSA